MKQERDQLCFLIQYTETAHRYIMEATSTSIPTAGLLRSPIQPTSSGMTAPPLIAIIIRPDISLLRSGYFPIVIEKTSGQIFATAIPIMKTSTHAMAVDFTSIISTRHSIPSNDDHMKNFDDENRVSIIAPANVPSIRPKK